MPDGRSEGVELIGYDAERGDFGMHSFDNRGSITTMRAVCEDEQWRFVGESLRFTGRFTADRRTLGGQWEVRDAEGEWAPLRRVDLNLEGARGLDDLRGLPMVAELRLGWSSIGSHLEVVGSQISAATLEAKGPSALPGTDGSRLEGVAFLVQHDSYRLGQVALLRRQLGRSAMR